MRLIRRQGLWWALGVVLLLGLGELALRARYRQLVLPAGGAKPDAVTIVALGDSITAGWPGPPEQAWPARLEARLRAAYPRWLGAWSTPARRAKPRRWAAPASIAVWLPTRRI